MNVYKQLESKEKAFKVVHSCITKEHLESAKKYVENYNKLFSDLIGYSELNRLILKKEKVWQKN